ncbi:MAG: hypothetical protein KKA84_06355 [Bacteroidetes bacterium]|nr:hypothetical protein [Bacteroidota bacterium]
MEKIINIYLIIRKGIIEELAAKEYELQGSDEEKISYLESVAETGLISAEKFNSPTNESGEKISYKIFQKFEKQGIHFNLFEEIFRYYDLGDTPLVGINPVIEE